MSYGRFMAPDALQLECQINKWRFRPYRILGEWRGRTEWVHRPRDEKQVLASPVPFVIQHSSFVIYPKPAKAERTNENYAYMPRSRVTVATRLIATM